MEEFETIPQTLRVDAMNRAWKFLQENSFYGMHPQSRVQAVTNKSFTVLQRHLRKRTKNNKLKRHHKPMKRQAELNDLDKMVRYWEKHCKRKGH